MARPQCDGLSYFPFDVDFFSDRKIKIIRGSEYGTDAIIIYIYLLCEIYKGKGYYIAYDDDLVCCASADTGVPEGKTRQIVQLLASKSLFDNTRFSADNLLTATSIQTRYQEAKKSTKRDVFVEPSVWILNEEATLGFIKVHPKESFSRKNPSKSEKNPDKSEKNPTKENKRKENKNKINKTKTATAIAVAPELEPAWQAFIEMRKKMRKPMTEYAMEITIKKLETLAPGDTVTQKKILEQSVERSWQSVYELKEKGGVNNGRNEKPFKPSDW